MNHATVLNLFSLSFFSLFLFPVFSFAQYQHDFTHIPMTGDCYPSDPRTKEYLDVRGNWLHEVKVISCDYICLDRNHKPHTINGTQKIRVFFGERGNEFVCKGFEMQWVPTPTNPRRWGYYTLGKTRPFSALSSDIEEILDWAKEHL